MAFSPSSAALRQGAEEAQRSAGDSLSTSAPQRASVQAPAGIPATTLSPGTVARSVCSGLFPVPQRSSWRSCVPGQLRASERSLLPLFFSFSCSAVTLSKAWVPEQPPWQQSAACRAADHLEMEQACACVCACVCVRVCRGRSARPFACACVCLHSCGSKHCLGWRSTCSSLPQPLDTRLEVMAVTFTPACPCEPAALSEY